MLDFITQDDPADVLGVLFVFKFRGMDADYHQFVWIFLFQLLEIGNDVHAVDAAVGPKVE